MLVTSVARSGAASSWGVAEVGTVVAEKPDVVLVEFAANDAALNRFVTPGRSRANMDAILARLGAAGMPPRVFVMAMSPVQGPRGWIRPFLDRYVEEHRRAAAEAGAGFVDHRPAWERLRPEALQVAIPDGLHPRPADAARVMVPTLVTAVSDGRCMP